ncbi:FGGY-family carbohydrate kinase [Pseudochryseolinea flava]|uniref:Carbohydrate kinase n=1 Tax=Pseudochryseolinea flava TaxID=2059302 RepID=A0A364Y284_9BACT|nr:FGGY family carbohydrate kinase [Pseudochryseolinea flava]RAW00983.1 carbohydrate kinase [Pseudochryseolinea flava]
MAKPVIAIFDIGKTNKKLFLFDERYNIVLEQSTQIEEIIDDDGDSCEDLHALTKWVLASFQEANNSPSFDIKAINVSTYGASFVHLGYDEKPVTDLYNYLKPFPESLKRKFYSDYGGESVFSMFTASPVLGNLNSGMQLYWLKHAKSALFKKINVSLHLPQYIASLFSKRYYSDITSIGCHTNLWNFAQNSYHDWSEKEGIREKLAPMKAGDAVVPSSNEENMLCGIGLHDSSAALIPYLVSFNEPFLLLSTGTWCISLNPFTDDPLTVEELEKGCLCYLTYKGNPVKASRLFSGYEHEKQINRLADHFQKPKDHYESIGYNATLVAYPGNYFEQHDLSVYETYELAYTQLIKALVDDQVTSTKLVLNNMQVKRIFVDGGFSKNAIFMNLLAKAFPSIEVYAAAMAQASALGAAMAIHQHWNKQPLESDVIALRYYTGASSMVS